MKIFFFLTGLLFITAGFNSRQGNKKQILHYPTHEKRLEATWYPECDCDSVVEFYQNGPIHTRYQRIHNDNFSGPLNGPYYVYYQSGVVSICENYKDGILDGIVYSNFMNGNKGYEGVYKDGNRIGLWKYFNDDGSVTKEEIFISDSLGKYGTRYPTYSKKYFLKNNLAYTQDYVKGFLQNESIINRSFYDTFQLKYRNGKALYESNCTMCHSMATRIVGPPLKDIWKRRSGDWIFRMIKNGQALIESGDKEARALNMEYGIRHPLFLELSDTEIQRIANYLKRPD
jgi:hypothetical protein